MNAPRAPYFPEAPSPEIAELVEQLCHGDLTTEHAVRLDYLVTSDAASRTFYVRYMHMHATLPWVAGAVVADQWPVASSEIQKSECAIPHSRSPILGFLGRTSAVLSKPVLWSILGVGLAFCGYFAVITWGIRDGRKPNGTAGFDSLVATISDSTNAVWSDSSLPHLTPGGTQRAPGAGSEEADVRAGETLKIDSGLVELKLKQGATLLVEGPASWSIDGDNRATLHAGKLVANVPKAAIGFTLNTPTAQVVDLGTEFGIEADERGATEVEVLEGKVELQPSAQTRGSSPQTLRPIILSAGSARRIESAPDGGVPIVREITTTPNRFARKVDSRKSRRIPVRGVLASSQCLQERDVYDLVNGSGLVGDKHSHDPDAMWTSEMQKVKGEYVLFDLGKPCRLESMKVWNYNENTVQPFFKMCGVKQASIYTSITGRFDETSMPNTWDAALPEAWHVVAAHREFAMADGTSEYMPEVISLNGVAARFVAIVIDDHFGEVPGLSYLPHNVVGLSEVQFFGDTESLQSSSKRKSPEPKDR